MNNSSLASFGKRLLAFIIDFMIVIFISLFLTGSILKPFGGILGVMGLENFEFGEDIVKGGATILMAFFGAAGVLLLAFFVCLFVGFLYDFLMICFVNQATVGKKVMNIKVVQTDGASLSFFEVFIRTVIKFITGFIFVFLWLICLFTEQRQTLHDKIANSLVVNDL